MGTRGDMEGHRGNRRQLALLPQAPRVGGHLPWKGWVMRVAAERATISWEVWEQREPQQEVTGM